MVTPAGEFQAKYAALMAEGDKALSAGDYARAEEQYGQAILAAVHGGYNSARWLFAAYVKLASASARDGKRDVAVGQIKTAIGIMTRSAVAIPADAYSSFVSEGDRYAQQKDYDKALEQYSKALQVISAKCNCGLENWSILP
jgi:tetratricopeptide (TPR) repeat protein